MNCGNNVRHAVAGILAVLLLFSGCGRQSKSTGKPEQKPAPVTISVAVETNVPVQLDAIGAVSAYSTVAVQSQVDGQLAKVYFQQGDEVRMGDLLAEIDTRTFQATLNQAEAVVAKDKANQLQAEAEERRNLALFTNGIVSADVLEQARATAQSLRAAVLADQAAVENASLQLAYCQIRSPVDGRTGNLLVTPGNLVTKLQTVIVVVNQIKPIYVDFSGPERELSRIRRAFASRVIEVEAAVPNEKPSSGRLLVIGNTVQTNTGNITLRAVFSNTNEWLWPGQFVNATMTLTVETNVVVIPSQAVQMAQSGNSVFVVGTNNIAEQRAVQTGIRYRNQTVIQKGVKPGEQVVTSGQIRVVPGSKVRIIQPSEPSQNGQSELP